MGSLITSRLFYSQDSIEALTRNQQRGLDSLLYNKANELQEDISMKKFDLKAKQISLAAIKAQVRVLRTLIHVNMKAFLITTAKLQFNVLSKLINVDQWIKKQITEFLTILDDICLQVVNRISKFQSMTHLFLY